MFHHSYPGYPLSANTDAGALVIQATCGVKFRSPWKTSSTMARSIRGMALRMQVATRLGGETQR